MKLFSYTLGLALALYAGNTQAQQLNDQDLKDNVLAIDQAVAQLQTLEPITYNYNTEKVKKMDFPTGPQYGFNSPSVEKSFPALVKKKAKVYSAGKNSSKSAQFTAVDQEALIPVLVAAINEQQAQIELLKLEIEKLKAQ